jgi:hypothetical protein
MCIIVSNGFGCPLWASYFIHAGALSIGWRTGSDFGCLIAVTACHQSMIAISSHPRFKLTNGLKSSALKDWPMRADLIRFTWQQADFPDPNVGHYAVMASDPASAVAGVRRGFCGAPVRVEYITTFGP